MAMLYILVAAPFNEPGVLGLGFFTDEMNPVAFQGPPGKMGSSDRFSSKLPRENRT